MARSDVTVEGLLAALDPDRRTTLEAVRAVIREAEPGLVEGVKWNAPSYAFRGEDRITFAPGTRTQPVRLVLHMGVKRAERKGAPPVLTDPAGIVTWSSDIRGVVAFADPAEVAAQRDALVDVLRRWLAIPV